jgi:hypothetical protein
MMLVSQAQEVPDLVREILSQQAATSDLRFSVASSVVEFYRAAREATAALSGAGFGVADVYHTRSLASIDERREVLSIVAAILPEVDSRLHDLPWQPIVVGQADRITHSG